MKIIQTSSELKQWLNSESRGEVGLVPTMGALHEGHASLIKRADKESDIVVLSILVNPTQFSNAIDLYSYPRTLDEDALIAKKAGVDVIFAPTAEDLYAGEPVAEKIKWGDLTAEFEAKHRPGHFDGVVAVVDKLFEAVMPQKAYFGEKDLQQVAVVRRLIDERGHSTELITCELLRNQEGLALSSRNARLSEAGRASSLKLFSTLSEAKKQISNGAPREETLAIHSGTLSLADDIALEYISGVNERTFNPQELSDNWTHIVVAAEVEGVRLIDNIRL
jgi:pantoate--beta-alanine ligase